MKIVKVLNLNSNDGTKFMSDSQAFASVRLPEILCMCVDQSGIMSFALSNGNYTWVQSVSAKSVAELVVCDAFSKCVRLVLVMIIG